MAGFYIENSPRGEAHW